MAYRVDFHTHSQASSDGSLSLEDYRSLLSSGLDFIAITDHDTIEFAQQARQILGERIIIGEEIHTNEGELIGLFLSKAVPAALTTAETARRIHQQGGLVYVPHPMETVRQGLSLSALNALAVHIDIVEAYNGRALFQNRSAAAKRWASAHQVAIAASSDAHGRRGWGRTYTILSASPTAQNLPTLLADARLAERTVGVRGVLYPKWNRLRKARRSHA